MGSIVGLRYNNADGGGGWTVPDKIFSYLDQAGNLYNKIRYPQPGDADYDAYMDKLRRDQAGIFGLPEPLGLIVLVGGVGLLGFIVYKIVNK